VHYKVSVSFLEVYNENIRDLLNDSEEFLDLREDPIKGIQFIAIFIAIISIESLVIS
jgi:kinesin family member 18/19